MTPLTDWALNQEPAAYDVRALTAMLYQMPYAIDGCCKIVGKCDTNAKSMPVFEHFWVNMKETRLFIAVYWACTTD